MGTAGLAPETTAVPVVSRLRELRGLGRWSPSADYSITHDALFAHDPRAVALLTAGPDGTKETTFGEVQRAALRIGGALRAHGVRPGDRVAMYLDPSPATAEVVFGVLVAGAVLLPIPPLLTGASVVHRLSDSGAKALVSDGPGLERLRSTGCAVDDRIVLTVDGAEGREIGERTVDPDVVVPHPGGPTQPALLMYTSGTSGPAKGVVHGHQALLGHIGVDYAFEFFQPDDVYYGTADWGWIGGLMLGLLVPWAFGVPVVAQRQARFDADVTLDLFARCGVTTAFLPPSVLRLLQANGRAPERRLRAVVTGGEPAGRAEMAWARRHLAQAVNKAYGQTEANALIGDSGVLGSVDDATMGAPYPGHRIALLDEHGQVVDDGEVGEIAVRLPDPVAMLGVWDAATARPVPTAGPWHHTGDLARRAYGHRLEYLGRADDVIKSRGYRIGPSEIEDALLKHPLVVEAAAVGIPDDRTGQHIKVFLRLADGRLGDTLRAELCDLVAGSVGPHAKPREFEVVSVLPRTETGKLLRRRLTTPSH
ncbi:AMP-binding protein [Actinacidiphila acidipaludis]|uniref:AMP-binding protein n=1 Tax=Actinacidiphila acidipaludis TaxID=2873382 RepID=A0ABS7PZB0_9ACTN|nr:AMP-binding protein [Streptomyces acidipaludis]MBY8876222.1 AMP-binding protein [Streptomyces acidipaludis]